MEPENINQEEVQLEQKSSLHQVTPLSKYLAMALFIILPFLGGYIGYSFAPEKVVEVEKVVIKEIEVEKIVEVPVEVSEQVLQDANTLPTGSAEIKTGILSPTEGEQFCLGEPIEINYVVPKNIKTVSISTQERPGAIAANLRTIQDTTGEYSTNTFLWGQNEQSAYPPSASYAHRISVEGFEDGDPSQKFILTSGVFAVIDCNI